MKISSNINKYNNYTGYNTQKKQNTANPVSSSIALPIGEKIQTFAYRDFNVSFGQRLNRSPEEFYAQPFNINNMPSTVKKYLNENFEEHHHMPPAQLQREAYRYLSIADNVDDVKGMYPDEELFKKLRPFSATKATRGTLFLLRWDALTSQTPIFKDKNEKDLTVYFLKKVYLEGKTIKEINQDFEKDSTDEIKRELGITNGKYFTHNDIASLGIRYPILSYYNSFLATRKDKEYIPPSRRIAESEQKGRPSYVMSDETKEKLSAASKRWWANLSKEEKEEQIKRIIEGKALSNSVYSRYQGPIMTLAAAKIGFSEKMIAVIEKRFTENDFNSDNETFAIKQREIMLEFWNNDPRFRKLYSEALHSIIAEFEKAYLNEKNPAALEKLINSALEVKQSLFEKAKSRQNARIEKEKEKQVQKPIEPIQIKEKTESPNATEPAANKEPIKSSAKEITYDLNSEKDILKLFKTNESLVTEIYPDLFKDKFLKYIMKTIDIEDKKLFVLLNMPNSQELMGLEQKEYEEKRFYAKELSEVINAKFNKEYPLIARTNDFILNKYLYEITNDPNTFKFERGDLMNFIAENDLYSQLVQQKNARNKEMKKYCTQLSNEQTAEFIKNELHDCFVQIQKNGFKHYKEFNNFKDLNKYTSLMIFLIETDDLFMKDAINFFKNYHAAVKYLKRKNIDSEAKNIILEKMILEHLVFCSSTNQMNRF